MSSLPNISNFIKSGPVRDNCKASSRDSNKEKSLNNLYEVRSIKLPNGSWKHYYIDHAAKTTYWVLPYSHPCETHNSLSGEELIEDLPSYEECMSDNNLLQVPEAASSWELDMEAH
eukprot:jgi/Galph1/603/GphlegSOOS_G5323.1